MIVSSSSSSGTSYIFHDLDVDSNIFEARDIKLCSNKLQIFPKRLDLETQGHVYREGTEAEFNYTEKLQSSIPLINFEEHRC